VSPDADSSDRAARRSSDVISTVAVEALPD
jgi:hypothetical protein